jgi:hypothetical protein
VKRVSFFRVVLIVAVVHVVVLAVLMALSVIPGLFRKPPERTIPISLVLEAVPDPPSVPDAPVVPAPPPPEPVTPTPTEIPEPPVRKPVTEKPKPPKPPIERSNVRVRRAAPTPVLTPEVVRRRLAQNLPSAPTASATDERDLALIHAALHAAWQQPSAASVGDAGVTAALRLEGDGRVVGRRIVNSSGNREMDATVQRALDAVNRIAGLAPSFVDRHPEVTIRFELD